MNKTYAQLQTAVGLSFFKEAGAVDTVPEPAVDVPLGTLNSVLKQAGLK